MHDLHSGLESTVARSAGDASQRDGKRPRPRRLTQAFYVCECEDCTAHREEARRIFQAIEDEAVGIGP